MSGQLKRPQLLGVNYRFALGSIAVSAIALVVGLSLSLSSAQREQISALERDLSDLREAVKSLNEEAKREALLIEDYRQKSEQLALELFKLDCEFRDGTFDFLTFSCRRDGALESYRPFRRPVKLTE